MNPGVTQEESQALMQITNDMAAAKYAQVHDLNKMIETLEIEQIYLALKESDGNRTRAAESLGLKRCCLLAKMKKYNIVY